MEHHYPLKISALNAKLSNFNCHLIQENKPNLSIERVVFVPNYEILKIGLDTTDCNALYVFSSSILSQGCPCPFPLQSVIVYFDEKPKIPEIFLNVLMIESDNAEAIFEEIKRQINTSKKLEEWRTRLNDMLLEGKSLQDMVNAASLASQNPIIVQTEVFQLLCHSLVQDVNEWLFRDIVEKKITPYEVIKHIRNSRFAEAYNSKLPVFVPKDSLIPSDTIVTRICIRNQVIGHVSLIAANKPFKEEDSMYMAILAVYIGKFFQFHDQYRQRNWFSYKNSLFELLENSNDNLQHLKEAMKSWNLNIGSFIRVLTIKDKYSNNPNIPLLYLSGKIEEILREAKVLTYKQEVVVVVDGEKDEFFIRNYRKKLQPLLLENHLVCGVSQIFFNISQLRAYYNQANSAIEMGISSGHFEEIFMYADYAMNHLLSIVASKEDPLVMCSRDILKILKYDKEHNTDYLLSLYVYLSYECNIKRASLVLNIHRNSLDYRLKKIFSDIQVDIQRPRDVFFMLFSIRFLIHCNVWKPSIDVDVL